MESPLLRAGVAAAQLALQVSPVAKKEEGVKEEGKIEAKCEVKKEASPPVKAETGHATAKKQKTEWQSALKKLPGDTTLARDILAYLALFIEPSTAGTSTVTTSAHPVDLVLNAFNNPQTSEQTTNKLKNFLEEAMRVHGKKLECAVHPDISKLLVPDSTVEHMTTAVPLSSIYIARPDDMPCIEDWTTCAVSYLFNGCRLHREPLDLNYNKSLALTDGDHAVKEQAIHLRTAGLFILLVASNMDPITGKDLIQCLLPAISDFWSLPSTITACGDKETVSFESIQLSTQGAERQRKDVLKLAARFERLIKERMMTETTMDESACLSDLISKYNSYRANSAIRKWQISQDQSSAIWSIIIGLDEVSRSLLRSHLDHNKWEESGYNESILRVKRHMLNETPKGLNPFWTKLLTVTPAVQHLHFQKYNLWWSQNARRVKRSMRARMRWTEEQWINNVNHCAVFQWVKEQSTEPEVTSEMLENMTQAFLNGDYTQDLDAIIVAKPSKITPQMTAMWQDHIGRVIFQPQANVRDECPEVDEAQDLSFGLLMNVQDHVAETFMNKRLLMLCSDKGKSNAVGGLTRRVLQDASQRFDSCDSSRLQNVGYVDLSKYGRLAAPEINDICTWCHTVLSQNPDYSMIFMCAPVLAGEGVINGFRGEQRRIEDKLNAMQMEAKAVQILFDTSTLYKAPRNSDLKLADDNVWTKSEYWNSLVNSPSAPLPVSEYVTPESGTFFTHEQGRSLTDRQETAQWFASPQTLRNIMESLLARVSSLKGQALVVQHLTQYDGVMEKVMIDLMNDLQGDCYIAMFSETSNSTIFQYALTGVKDKLLEEWKAARGQIGLMTPKFQPEADLSTVANSRMPQLKLCQMSDNGHLTIPKEVRDKWLMDPAQDENVDLGGDQPTASRAAVVTPCEMPPALSAEEFQSKHATVDATITLNMGSNVTCYVVGAKLFVTSSTKVVLEETTSQGAADTAPMRRYDLIVMLEKKGILDTSVTGHAVDRPAEVKRGEEQDRVEVVHESYSLFKPNNVAAKTAKATNVAGVVGFKALSSSNYLQLEGMAMPVETVARPLRDPVKKRLFDDAGKEPDPCDNPKLPYEFFQSDSQDFIDKTSMGPAPVYFPPETDQDDKKDNECVDGGRQDVAKAQKSDEDVEMQNAKRSKRTMNDAHWEFVTRSNFSQLD
ncbi:Uncharacterized protein SCF082_LOCUS51755 [Durusdinium trenchii]|uniref:Uncharacterized protein n=1 Tax=Durusdinium trenchii TaxID=1381693 RepID=A0ABP0SGP9_9DINO